MLTLDPDQLGNMGGYGRSCYTKNLSQVRMASCLFTQKGSIWPHIEGSKEDTLLKLGNKWKDCRKTPPVYGSLPPKKYWGNLDELIIPNLKKSTSASLNTLKALPIWITTNCGKFLKRWEYQTTLPAFWEVYAGQKATARTGHGTMDWFQIGKGVGQGCILSPCLFNLYAEYIMRNAGLDEAQAGIKIARRNINNLRYAEYITLMEESGEELKSLLKKVKQESEKLA